MDSWKRYMTPEIYAFAESLSAWTDTMRAQGHIIYPAQEQIFRALELTPPQNVRAVILGQDPYHGPGQANGLAFSVAAGVKIPPSLRNIFKELHSDTGYSIPESGDLTAWAEQGVLLLNTILTVEAGKPASHAKWGWQMVVAEVLRICYQDLPQPIVFLLWGGHAQTFAQDIVSAESRNKRCLWSSHPSPLGANKGNDRVPAFIGSRPFSTVNTVLQEMGADPIDWSL